MKIGAVFLSKQNHLPQAPGECDSICPLITGGDQPWRRQQSMGQPFWIFFVISVDTGGKVCYNCINQINTLKTLVNVYLLNIHDSEDILLSNRLYKRGGCA